MTDADVIIDVITYGVALMFIAVMLAVVAPFLTERSVEGRIQTNYNFMKSQEVALVFMRDNGGTGLEVNRLLTLYYSLEEGQSIEVNGESLSRDSISDTVRTAVKTYTTPPAPAARWVRPQGFSLGGRKTGIVLPVPTSKGGVRKVWVWN